MIALYIFLGLIGLLIIYICLTSLIYKRSFFASIVAIYLLFTSKRKRHGVIKKSFKNYLLNMEKENPYYKVETKTKVNIKEIYYDNVQTLIFNDTKDIDNVIIYYHGGAYISKPLKYHISFVDKLAINTNSIVIFPIYPKAPKHHYDDAIKLAINLYNVIINNTNKNIIKKNIRKRIIFRNQIYSQHILEHDPNAIEWFKKYKCDVKKPQIDTEPSNVKNHVFKEKYNQICEIILKDQELILWKNIYWNHIQMNIMILYMK